MFAGKVHWLGWENLDFVLTLDLGKDVSAREISWSTLSDQRSWILHPEKVACAVSADGGAYREIGASPAAGDHRGEEPIRVFPEEQSSVCGLTGGFSCCTLKNRVNDRWRVSMNESDAEEDLAFVRRIIEESRKILIDNGLNYILWGILIALGLIFVYFKDVRQWPLRSDLFWLGWGIFGTVLTIWIGRKTRAGLRASSFSGRMLKTLWAAAAISMVLIGFFGFLTEAIRVWAFPAVFSIILGLAYFLCALLYDRAWIRLLAVAWWLGGVAMFFWKSPETLLLFGAMMAAFQVVPGIALYLRYGKERTAETDD